MKVTPAALVSIKVVPMTLSVPKGWRGDFAVFGRYTDATTRNITRTAALSSSNPAMATVAGDDLITHSVGITIITATDGGLTATANLTVTPAVLRCVVISPYFPMVKHGATVALQATGVYTDGTTVDLTGSATWSSGNTKVATVSAAGVVTGVADGVTTIKASASAISAVTLLRVY